MIHEHLLEVYVMMKTPVTLLYRTHDIETICLSNNDKDDSLDLMGKLKLLKRQPEIGEMQNLVPIENNLVLTEEDFFERFRADRDFVWLDILRAAVTEIDLIRITKMDRKQFDEWRTTTIKMTFKSILSVKEHCEFIIATRRDEDYMKWFMETLTEEKKNMYSQWKNKTIPSVPPFFNEMNLKGNAQEMFIRRCLQEDFDSLDYFMKVYGNYEIIYNWWKEAIKSTSMNVTTTHEEVSEE